MGISRGDSFQIGKRAVRPAQQTPSGWLRAPVFSVHPESSLWSASYSGVRNRVTLTAAFCQRRSPHSRVSPVTESAAFSRYSLLIDTRIGYRSGPTLFGTSRNREELLRDRSRKSFVSRNPRNGVSRGHEPIWLGSVAPKSFTFGNHGNRFRHPIPPGCCGDGDVGLAGEFSHIFGNFQGCSRVYIDKCWLEVWATAAPIARAAKFC